eukprot:TRINITY_DN12909_c0_g1_i2.p1 TRINITY_DN12909_c0_g1~~TRINITY_DN12909_c0_g1_i2.p1  ORF type:complete len:325 (+),score=43.55 TRINITY_DN12909_c0_g1_i2:61-975(+)
MARPRTPHPPRPPTATTMTSAAETVEPPASRALRVWGGATLPPPQRVGPARRAALRRKWLARLAPVLRGDLSSHLWKLFESCDGDGDCMLMREEAERFTASAFAAAGVPLPADQTLRADVLAAMRAAAPNRAGVLAPALSMTSEEVAAFLTTSGVVQELPQRWRPPREERWHPSGPVMTTLSRLQRLCESGRERELRLMLVDDIEWTWVPLPAIRGVDEVAKGLIAEKRCACAKEWYQDPEMGPGGWSRMQQSTGLVGTSVLTVRTTVWLSKDGFIERGITSKDRTTPLVGGQSLSKLMEITCL